MNVILLKIILFIDDIIIILNPNNKISKRYKLFVSKNKLLKFNTTHLWSSFTLLT